MLRTAEPGGCRAGATIGCKPVTIQLKIWIPSAPMNSRTENHFRWAERSLHWKTNTMASHVLRMTVSTSATHQNLFLTTNGWYQSWALPEQAVQGKVR